MKETIYVMNMQNLKMRIKQLRKKKDEELNQAAREHFARQVEENDRYHALRIEIKNNYDEQIEEVETKVRDLRIQYLTEMEQERDEATKSPEELEKYTMQ